MRRNRIARIGRVLLLMVLLANAVGCAPSGGLFGQPVTGSTVTLMPTIVLPVAALWKTPVEQIARYNQMNEVDGLAIGQVLQIPSNP